MPSETKPKLFEQISIPSTEASENASSYRKQFLVDRYIHWTYKDKVRELDQYGMNYLPTVGSDQTLWLKPVEDGFCSQPYGSEVMATMGVNACFAGIIDYTCLQGKQRLLLHSTPSRYYSTQGKSKFPFDLLKSLLISTDVEKAAFIHNTLHPETIPAVTEAVHFLSTAFPSIQSKVIVYPYGRFDIQCIKGGVSIWDAGKDNGFMLNI
jgi:hypothetical protein